MAKKCITSGCCRTHLRWRFSAPQSQALCSSEDCMSIKKSIYYGRTRRKVDEVWFEMSAINRLSSDHFTIEAEITGFPEIYNRSMTRCVEIEEREKSETNPTYPSIKKTIEAWSEFDVLVNAMAYFRQHQIGRAHV